MIDIVVALGIIAWIGLCWLVVIWFMRGASDASETLKKERENESSN
jgi:hypothetical protein